MALLAEAGPQRARWLGVLYKDDIAPKSPLYPILEHVFNERVLRAEEIQQLSTFLQAHHLEKKEGGFSGMPTPLVICCSQKGRSGDGHGAA